MCTCSSRRYGSVSSRNASSSPARARTRVCSVTTACSSRRLGSLASQGRTSGRRETRRPVFAAARASTTATRNRALRGAPTWERSSSARTSRSTASARTRRARRASGTAAGSARSARRSCAEWARLGHEEAVGADALLMGRRSDAYFGPRWVARNGEWADRLNGLPKYVVSSTLAEPLWSNSTVLRGDVVEEVVAAEAGARRRDRRHRQPAARAHAAGARPRRRGAADGLPVRARRG